MTCMYQTGLALSLAARRHDRGGLEVLLAELDGVGEILDATAVAMKFAPGHQFGDVTDDRLRELLLRHGCAS